MLSKVAALVREYDMIMPGDHIICAVSGGADSMALLWSMYLLREKWQIQLSAAHFNHNLRGEESDADAAFVQSFCDRYDIPLFTESCKVRPGAMGLEAAAREARYSFFATLPGKIATAHTADDNAETVLLHLVRGTGLKGLGGIAPVRGRIIRPMLDVTRQEVLELLEEYHISYREDSSNSTDQFLRNRLRHHVMPLLREENPKLAENLSATARSLRWEEKLLDQMSKEFGMPGVSELRQLHPALRGRILEQFLKSSGVREPERNHIALLENVVFSDNPSAKATFPGNVTISRQYDTLCVLQEVTLPNVTKLSCPGITELPQWGLRIICTEADVQRNTPDVFTVSPVGAVCIRSRQPGDTIRLAGGTKTLKKLFIDRKIPAAQRSCIPVLADDVGVLGVWGVGADLDRLEADLCFRFEPIDSGENRS